MIKINFSYTDEFGQESALIKTFTEDVLEVSDTFTMLVDEFKSFMRAAGFAESLVDSIIIEEV